jgi:transposase InsO family protein
MAGRDVPMSLRRLIVEIDLDGLNVREFCAEHGVSTWFFYDLRRRHEIEGDGALEPKSRAPKHVANRTPVDIEEAIIAMRKQLVDAGLDEGPESIAWHLRDLSGLPSTSTIWRILGSRGFIVPAPQKAPKRAKRRFNASRANESWQLDDTTWELADGTAVKILNVLDDHSRLLLDSRAMATCTGVASLDALFGAAELLGWPTRIQSDNARTFRDQVASALEHLGVAAVHSRPYHPETNGKVERFHQTLKRWLRKQNPAATITELQAQLDLFRLHYNHHRPHRSLDRQTPGQIWTQAPKAGPADRPLGLRSTIHTTKVRADGRVQIGKRLQISLGNRYRGRSAHVIITGTDCHVFVNGHIARHLTIDPRRVNQPLHDRPGRPTTTVRDVPRQP